MDSMSPDVFRVRTGGDGDYSGNRNFVAISGHSDVFTYTEDGVPHDANTKHLLILDKDGKLWSMGENRDGQSGNRGGQSNGEAFPTPVVLRTEVPAEGATAGEPTYTYEQMSNVTAIATGNRFSAAISKDSGAKETYTYTRSVVRTDPNNGDAVIGTPINYNMNATAWGAFEMTAQNGGYVKTTPDENTVVYTRVTPELDENNDVISVTTDIYTKVKGLEKAVEYRRTETRYDQNNKPVASTTDAPNPVITILREDAWKTFVATAEEDGYIHTTERDEAKQSVIDRYTKDSAPDAEGFYTRTEFRRVEEVAIYDLYELYTFGSNAQGQLAQGKTTANYFYPTKVDFDTGDEGAEASVLTVSGGENHIATVKQDGYMWTSGSNASGQLGNGSDVDSNTMVMVGKQVVNAKPSTITMIKGQTINISREIIKDRDKPLTVTYEAGINLLLKGNSGVTTAELGEWTASSLNEEMVSVMQGIPDGSTYNHPDFDVDLARAAEDNRQRAIQADLEQWKVDFRRTNGREPTLAESEAQQKILAAARPNEYIKNFIDEHAEFVNQHPEHAYPENYYSAAGNIVAPQIEITEGDYYITGHMLGQTTLRIRVPGLTAAAHVTVKVMADNSSKANPMVALGQDHTLALKSDGSVWSWGNNDRGQLGRSDYETMGQVIFPHMIEQVLNDHDYLGHGMNYFEYHGITQKLSLIHI